VCEAKLVCDSTNPCPPQQGYTAICQAGFCTYNPIIGCNKPYQDQNNEGRCVFSISKFFSKPGFISFYNDYQYETIAGGAVILALIVLLVVYAIKKSKTPTLMGG